MPAVSELAAGGSRRIRARWVRLQRQALESDRPALVSLMALAIALTVGGVAEPDVVPQVSILLPIVLASLWLGPRTLPWFVIFCLGGVVVLATSMPDITTVTVVRSRR